MIDRLIKSCIIILILILCCKRKEEPEEINVINISNTLGRSENPGIACDSRGYFYVVWDDKFVNGESLVIYMVSRPPGGEWSKPVKIFEPRAARDADIEIDNSNTIHLVWQNWNSEGWIEILYSQKPLNGNWTKPETISIYGMSCTPALAVGMDGSAHLVWVELQGDWPVFYTKKTINSSWSGPIKLSLDGITVWSDPKISVDPQRHAHVVWAATLFEPSPINWVTYTTNAQGDTWAYPTVIACDSLLEITTSTIEIDNDYVVHIVWSQDADIFYAFRSLSSNWSTPARVCSTAAMSGSPQLAISDNTLHLVWSEGENMFCYTSKEKGSDWEKPQEWLLSGATGAVIDIAVSSSNVGIVIQGCLAPNYDNDEIYFCEIPKN